MSSSERSGLSWIFIIAFGILLGNALSFITYGLYSNGKIPQSMNDLTNIFSSHSAQSPEQFEAQKKLDGTCEYWKEQVDRKDSEQNRAFRDMACARARGMFR